ncbi:hypothetical protein C5S39_08860 [Candidatus Methanophagaceae archaeon]|nr:hypothetical protein C5S39_08860 [Methanophagales archaeon]
MKLWGRERNLPKIPLGENGQWRNGFEERLGGVDGAAIRPFHFLAG